MDIQQDSWIRLLVNFSIKNESSRAQFYTIHALDVVPAIFVLPTDVRRKISLKEHLHMPNYLHLHLKEHLQFNE